MEELLEARRRPHTIRADRAHRLDSQADVSESRAGLLLVLIFLVVLPLWLRLAGADRPVEASISTDRLYVPARDCTPSPPARPPPPVSPSRASGIQSNLLSLVIAMS